MFARVLYVGAMPLGEADPAFRLCEALRRGGHAVQAQTTLWDDGDPSGELASALRAFRPSLVVWDVTAAPADEALATTLARAGVCVALLAPSEAEPALACAREAFAPCRPQLVVRDDEGAAVAGEPGGSAPAGVGDARSLRLSAAPDRGALEAVLAVAPAQGRVGLGCVQAGSPEGEAEVSSALAACPCLRPVLAGGGWAATLAATHPGERASYHLRCCRYAVLLPGRGACAPTVAQAAQRVAEGALVVAARGSLPSRGPLEDAVPTFEPGGLAGLLGRLESDEALRAATLGAQRTALAAMPPLEASVEALLDALDARARAAGLPPVRAVERPARKVVVYGWLGARNFGDDLLLRVTMSRLAARFPECHVVVSGAGADVLRREFGVATAPQAGGPELERAVRGASAVVYLGGLVFDEPAGMTAGVAEFSMAPCCEPSFQADLALLAWLLGVPAVGLGLGSGPISMPATRAAVRLMGLAGMRFLPRDENMGRQLLAAGVPAGQVRVKADLVLGARDYLEQAAAKGTPLGLAPGSYFVVSPCERALNPAGIDALLARLAGRAARRTGKTAVIVPFDAGDSELGHRVRDLLARDGLGDAVRCLEARPDEPEMLALMRDSSFAIAMRLHCSVLQHVLGGAALGLDYNDKVRAHYGRMGQADVLLPLDADSRLADETLDRLLDDLPAREHTVAERVREAARLVDEAFEELFSLVEGARPEGEETGREVIYLREESLPAMAARRAELALGEQGASRDWLEAELRAAREEAEALRAEVRDVRASHSYRLGNAFMRVPAAIRRALHGGS